MLVPLFCKLNKGVLRHDIWPNLSQLDDSSSRADLTDGADLTSRTDLQLTVSLSHPVHDWTSSPDLVRPQLDPPDFLNFYLNILLHLLVTYSFLLCHPRTPLQTLPVSGHLLHPAPLRSIILFTLLLYLPYLCLPVCIRFLVPDSDSCPYSPDSDRTSYTDPIL